MDGVTNITLEQGLRERLAFDLFACNEVKADLESIKEEELKTEFRHIWHITFCSAISSITATPIEQNLHAMNGAIVARVLYRDLEKAYPTIANKIKCSPADYFLKWAFTKEDMRL